MKHAKIIVKNDNIEVSFAVFLHFSYSMNMEKHIIPKSSAVNHKS